MADSHLNNKQAAELLRAMANRIETDQYPYNHFTFWNHDEGWDVYCDINLAKDYLQIGDNMGTNP